MIKIEYNMIFLFSEVTEGAIEVWASLPDEIRLDQSFVPFHQEHDRRKSKTYFHEIKD